MKINKVNTLLDYKDNLEDIDYAVENSKFEILFQYTNFDILDMYSHGINWFSEIICFCHNVNIIKHIIDNAIDLEVEDKEGWRPIHFICNYSTREILQHIVNKNVDLNCKTDNNLKPIHYLCSGSNSFDTILWFINLNTNLEEDDKSLILEAIYDNPSLNKISKTDKEELFNKIKEIRIEI